MPRYENRMQLALALVVGLLLLANLFTLTLVALAPATRAERAPLLLAVFIITLVVSVPSILLLPRWLLRPYRRLVDEAERAPLASVQRAKPRDETEFVLETFQGVVAELRDKQRELERLGAQASERAATAEQFSERVVASLPSGLLAFAASGLSTVVNAPARSILGLDGACEGEDFRALLEGAPELAELVGRCLRTGELYRREEVSACVTSGRARRLGVTVAPIEPTPAGGALIRDRGPSSRGARPLRDGHVLPQLRAPEAARLRRRVAQIAPRTVCRRPPHALRRAARRARHRRRLRRRARRRAHAPAGPAQPPAQRSRGHPRRQGRAARYCSQLARARRDGPRLGARRDRRHGHGHSRRRLAANVHPLLHHQIEGPRHRPRPRAPRRHRARRHALGLQFGERRRSLHAPPSCVVRHC